MADQPSNGQELQQQMAQIRCELYDDVQEFVENAQTITDWRYYIRTYPWACVGAATAIGYLAVPQRIHVMHPDPSALAELARRQSLVVEPASVAAKRSAGWASRAFGFVANLALRSATSFAMDQLGKIMEAQAAQPRATEPPRTTANPFERQ